LSLTDILEIASRVIWKIKNHKRVLIGVLLIAIFVTAVSAVVYNYMSIQSNVGVNVTSNG